AVDVREDVIAFAKRTYGHKRIQWRVADLRALEPEAGAYDLVTSFGLVEQLDREEVQDYLEQLKRALKPGGTALISIRGQEAGQAVDGKESFREMAAAVFGKVDMLGQRPWSEQTELTGQCVVSGRVADDDGGVVVVCKKRAVSAAPEMGEAPRVSIVMPLYNKVEYTEACLKGLEEAAGKTPCELVLVDNGSSDGTGALLDRMERRARVIRCGENLGFSRGNNLGAGYARGEYLLFLNNDIVPHAGWLDAMVAEVDADPEVGIVGARLLYPDSGKVQHAGIELVNGTPDHVYRNVPGDDPGVMKSRDLDMVTGACLLIRKEVFEQLGGFDEAYVNGVEDVDLCLKVRKKGYRVRYCADAVLDHYEGTSEGRYSHVRPNLERFVKRWNGQFDAQGRFIAPAPRAETALRGCWEGTQFVYHSLSLVNMALTSELIRSGQCELKLIPYEAATFGVEVDPERYSPIAERINAALSGPAQFHVRHMWPPNFTPPPEGHWVMIQPWEFGKIPEEWVAPIQEGVDEVWVPSSYVKQCYVEGGVDADRVQVIPNGVRTDLFRPDAPPMKLDTEKTFKFLFVGGMIFRKGIDVLLKAYTETFRRWDDVCLVVKTMGSETFYKGQAPEEMIQKIQADPDAPEILFLTQELSEEEMAGLYTACNCLTHPYRGEGFGLPVAEAMACGLPVMVTAGGACDDFCAEDRAYFIPATRKEVSVRW
ncbi:MAG: glycosyltransferase, partial [bacterium]|nr:glycosyltransferase [bacterium]